MVVLNVDRIFKLLIVILFVNYLPAAGSIDPPFEMGVNLSSWFQENSANEIQFTKFTHQDIKDIRSLGFDVIRLPINLHAMTDGAPDYVLDPLFLYFLDQVVDWCEGESIHLILDNHTFDPSVDTELSVREPLMKVWPQMAAHFRHRSELIHYEILNEPHGIGDADWNAIQLEVVDAIREVDSVHTIVVGPAGWNSYNNLQAMPDYADTNLIYTFHFYEPFLFTHQGASWTDPSMVPVAGVPYPYKSNLMPAVPPSLQGTWVGDAFGTYSQQGTMLHMLGQMNIASNFAADREVPMFCGEFGVYRINADDSHRGQWYQDMKFIFDMKGIAWTMWDYRGGFGLFHDNTAELFPYDLNIEVCEGLGLTLPDSIGEYVPEIIDEGFYLYRDHIEAGLVGESYVPNGSLDYYCDLEALSGEYCIRIEGGDQYGKLAIGFRGAADLSMLAAEDYFVEFYLKSSDTLAFDLRFVDTKAGAEDHPWRMGISLGASQLVLDGNWHKVQIPLADMVEKGSWDNAWYEPAGLFDWSKVDVLEFVAEAGPLSGKEFFIDDIAVRSNAVIGIEDERAANYPDKFELTAAPNPFNSSLELHFEAESAGAMALSVYDLQGRCVHQAKIRVERGQNRYQLDLSSSGLAGGIYFVRLSDARQAAIEKIIYLK